MRGIITQGVTLFAAAGLVVALAACTPSPGSSTTTGGGLELVKSKCTMCHTIDRINQANKDRAGWEATVARMREKGAVLTDAEAAQVVGYLSQVGGSK
jgi:mono/diheme cytochrome c family protein